jgi:acyl-CoA synthetase (AMP-forming)/AMP-acid ligase II
MKFLASMIDALSEEEVRLIATFFGLVIAGAVTTIIGYKRGRPTPAAATVAAIQEASVCKVSPALVATVEKLAGDLDELRREVRDHHHEREEEARRANEKLVRIEDRTKRG